MLNSSHQIYYKEKVVLTLKYMNKYLSIFYFIYFTCEVVPRIKLVILLLLLIVAVVLIISIGSSTNNNNNNHNKFVGRCDRFETTQQPLILVKLLSVSLPT